MNKKVNTILNIIELISILLIGLCLVVSMAIDFPIGSFNEISHLEIVKSLVFFSSLFMIVIVVSIELFLFFNYKLKYKFLYILYMIIDLIISLYINTFYPFFGTIIVLLFCIMKSILRINNVSKYYIDDLFYMYCELYNISIKNEETITLEDTKIKKEKKDKKETASVSNKKKNAVAV